MSPFAHDAAGSCGLQAHEWLCSVHPPRGGPPPLLVIFFPAWFVVSRFWFFFFDVSFHFLPGALVSIGSYHCCSALPLYARGTFSITPTHSRVVGLPHELSSVPSYHYAAILSIINHLALIIRTWRLAYSIMYCPRSLGFHCSFSYRSILSI